MKFFYNLLFLAIISLQYFSLSFNYHFFKFNSIIRKPLEDSLIYFIKIHNVNYIKVRNNSNYLILKYYHEPNEFNKKTNEKKLISNINNNLIVIKDDNKNNLNFIDEKNYHNYLTLNDDDDNNNDFYSQTPNIIDDDIENTNLKIYDLIRTNKKPLVIIYEKSNIYKYSYLIKNRTSYISKYILKYNKKNYKYSFIINASYVNKYETNWIIDAKFNYRNESFINMTRNYIKDWILYNINGNVKNYFYKKYLLSNYYN
jgi:hypothetical protein